MDASAQTKPDSTFLRGASLRKAMDKKYPVLFTKKCRLKILEAQNKPISPTALFFDFVVLS
ncbi:hypothetical protein [Neisseria blantyrii]|uniref:hypothetical protein n=1 Tax=Neisseria blantyrii TaxID=2830647 RepID=UPI00272D9C7E|nr:hypothetical protein [Neisseria blantyrii]